MRIGIDARLYSSAFTGIGRYVFELIHHVARIDTANNYVLFFNDPEFEKFSPQRNGVEKVLVNARHYSLAEQWRFWKILKKSKLDLMHFTHFNAPILYRQPSVVTIHDLTLSLYPGKKMCSLWARMAYHFTIRSIVKRAASVIAVSEHTKKDLVNLLHADATKINVIHEGVNPIFHKINDQHIIDDFKVKMGFDKPYILYTGVWRSHKNLVNLIKAFSILKHKYKFTGFLVITGKDDPWYPEVKQTVNEEKLVGDVRFTGLVPDEDLVLLYNAASVYVLPSLYEGFGLPILESFACGVPVCAAKSSSLPEICGNAAELFDPRDPADMAAKIHLVYKDATIREDLIQRGHIRVKEFSWEKMAKETLAVYNKISSAV